MITDPWTRLRPPRRDASALGFGTAFLVLGVVGLCRSAGVDLEASWLSQLALIAIGIAGLITILAPSRRGA
jgi:hypothetical protein